MLARTADNLYWLARYMERADFIARIIEATLRLEALPKDYGGSEPDWESSLDAVGVLDIYRQIYPAVTSAIAVDFLAFDYRNPSSIRNCINAARTNARAVRTALTRETWEAINSAWLELKRFEDVHAQHGYFDRETLARFLDFAKKTSLDADGSAYRTMLRNDVYWFQRLGLYLERADNTARILDMKYHVLFPESDQIKGSRDYFQWTTILRTVSALTAYHWVYRDQIKPWQVADLLILRPEMPRSLISCYSNIVQFSDSIGRAYGQQGASQTLARDVLSRLETLPIQDIFASGLHGFVTHFIDDNNRLGTTITNQYLLT
jgi:uncharacterized alpha-E superfamily protein